MIQPMAVARVSADITERETPVFFAADEHHEPYDCAPTTRTMGHVVVICSRKVSARQSAAPGQTYGMEKLARATRPSGQCCGCGRLAELKGYFGSEVAISRPANDDEQSALGS